MCHCVRVFLSCTIAKNPFDVAASGSAGGGLTLPAVVSSLCFIMRNKGLRSTMKAAKLGVSRRHSAGSTGANAEHEASSSSDSDDDSVVFAEL